MKNDNAPVNKDIKKYQLIWKAGFNTDANRITIGSYTSDDSNAGKSLFKALSTDSGLNSRYFKLTGRETPSLPVDVDYLQTYLRYANTHDLILPFNNSICLAQEYTPQVNNKVAQYATLGGNSVVSFGTGIKKISMKVSIIKAGKYWVPYSAGLEALAIISGQPSRFLGSLFLQGYDTTSPSKARKYKVVIDSLSPSFRSDRNNTVDYDLNFIVTYDYSAERLGKWGKL